MSPVKGKQSISTKFQGLLLYFSSQENKRKFLDDNEKYLPKYGGQCAYAIVNTGKKVDVAPFSYAIKNGELYFSTSNALLILGKNGFKIIEI